MPDMRLFHLACRCVPRNLDLHIMEVYCGLDPDHKGDHWYETWDRHGNNIVITWPSERPDAYS